MNHTFEVGDWVYIEDNPIPRQITALVPWKRGIYYNVRCHHKNFSTTILLPQELLTFAFPGQMANMEFAEVFLCG